jgi:hypothetical protein
VIDLLATAVEEVGFELFGLLNVLLKVLDIAVEVLFIRLA